MKDKHSANMKSATIVATIAIAAGWFAVSLTESEETASAATNKCEYNSSLPASHPSNLCAQPIDDVSWSNWLVGKSRSGQFHFLDLLELLHGHNSRPTDDVNPTTTQQSSF